MRKKNLAILYYENNFKNSYKLGKELKKKFNIIYISSSFFESVTNLDIYHQELIRNNETCYSFKHEIFEFYKNNNSLKTNKKYIQYFEKKYLKNVKINDLINYDYFLNEKNNPREDVYFPKNKKKKLFLLTLILKKIEKILLKHKIDIFFTMFPGNIINNIFYYYSKNRNKKFLCSYQCRNNRITISENFGFDIPNLIKKNLKNKIIPAKLDKIKRNLKKSFLKETNNKSNINNLLSGIVNEIKRLIIHFLNIRKFYLRNNDEIKLKNKLGFDTIDYYQKKQFTLFFVHLRYILRSFFLHFYIFFKSKNVNDLINSKYIYIPLHYFPEAYIYNQPKFDEIDMLKNILKNLPKNIKVLIKPHFLFFQYGYEQHKMKYYLKLLKDERAIITSPFACSITLIKNAITTVSFMGTSLLQSVLVGKPSISFGNSDLNAFSGIYNFSKNFSLNKLSLRKVNHKYNYKILYLINKNSLNLLKRNSITVLDFSSKKKLNNFIKLFLIALKTK